MKKAMEYHIISGRIIETRRCWLPCREGGKKKRGTRIAGNSSLRKIAQNERDAVKRLARTLNANFGEGFLFVTLKYSNGRLPGDYEAARQIEEKFLRKARAAYRKDTGEKLRYVAVTANWSPKRSCPARLHHHIVMAEASLDMLARVWPQGEFYVKRVSNPGDLTKLAAYLLDNVHGLPAGKKKYRPSQGLLTPVYTDPVEVGDVEGIVPLQDTAVVDGEPSYNEDGLLVGSYIRAVAPCRPRVRGSMVILPRRGRKRRGESGEYLPEVRETDE